MNLELIFIHTILLDNIYKCIKRKGIMLHRYLEGSLHIAL